MSHFTTIKTRIKDLSILQEVLEEAGLTVEKSSLVRGYQGNNTKANLVVRMNGNYDLGYTQPYPGGDIEAVADFWGLKIEGGFDAFQQKVVQEYSKKVIKLQALQEGLKTVEEEVMQDGTIRLVVAGWK